MINKLTLKKNDTLDIYPQKFTVFIDDQPFLKLVESFEFQFSDRINGAYTNALSKEDIQHRMSHVGARFLPLACDCGFEECWFLVGEVTMFDEYVSWGRWENPYRSDKSKAKDGLYWNYKSFPSLVFEASQYQSAIANALTYS